MGSVGFWSDDCLVPVITKSSLTLSVCCFVLQALPSVMASTLADWTFESSRPTAGRPPGVWLTNISAELGTGTASAWHSSSAVHSSFPGNGSISGFGVTNGWSVGDFFQFTVSTVGWQSIQISYDQSGSSGGPGTFFLEYSTDGNSFAKFGSDYSVKTGNWSSSVASTTNSYSFDLSSVASLNNQTTVYLRIVDNSNIAINGSTVSTFGYTDNRLDNVIIGATVVPEPSFASLGVLGALIGLVRRAESPVRFVTSPSVRS
jgi:hypothetical protein